MRLRDAIVWATVSVLAARAAADPVPDDEVKLVRDRGTVVTDGKGHYLAMVVFDEEGTFGYLRRIRAYYGSAKQLDRLPGMSDRTRLEKTGAWNLEYLDPRFRWMGRSAIMADGNGGYRMDCNTPTDRKADLKPWRVLADAEARRLLKAARLTPPKWDREPYLAARDDRTTYIYIDRALAPPGNTDFRVYVGKRGDLKLARIIEVVSDRAGDSFFTSAGDVRLIRAQDGSLSGTWESKARPDTKIPLINVTNDTQLIYSGLNVYKGKRFGSPCDDP